MGLEWNMVGSVATVAQIAGLDSLKLIAMIASAAKNARMHKKNCRKFSQHLKLIGNLLEQLKLSELKQYPETREPLYQLEDALRRAYLLVSSCQDRSYLYLLAMGWTIVNEFKRCQAEIDRLLHLVPLINLVENSRAAERLRAIEKDAHDYALDEEEAKLQEAVLKSDRTSTESIELQKSLSRSYPGLALHEALKKENEKLRMELCHMEAIRENDQCDVIEHLIGITETAEFPVVKDVEERKAKTSQCQQSEPSSYTYQEHHISQKNAHGNKSSKWSHDSHTWHYGLYECYSSPFLCISTFMCPCATFGNIAASLSDGIVPAHAACSNCVMYSFLLGCCCYTSCYRRDLRKRYDIPGGTCDDFWAHVFCLCCALVQESREIRAHSGKKVGAPSRQSMERG